MNCVHLSESEITVSCYDNSFFTVYRLMYSGTTLWLDCGEADKGIRRAAPVHEIQIYLHRVMLHVVVF